METYSTEVIIVNDIPLPKAWDELTEAVRKEIHPAADAVMRNLVGANGVRGFLIYLKGTVSVDRLEDHLLEPLLHEDWSEMVPGLLNWASVPSAGQALNEVFHGKAVLFIEGKPHAIAISAPNGESRGIQEPATEAVIRGPREGFVERIDTNIALVRNKIRTSRLKLESFTVGSESQTKVVLAYHDGIARSSLIEEVRKRIEAIEIDGVLESGYIEEFIVDQPRSPFPQMIYSERPDTVAAQLLEGRFAIFVDGTPFVITGPVTFWQMLHSPEDYYEKFIFSSFLLWLRYLLLFLALFLPGIYVATITFHHDLLPTSLLLSIAAARESIPFPALVEALIMEVSFEALREAGVRLPKTVGQAVSILGALVIGQAAVQAGIVSAPMVIVVSMTGIASFTIPRFNFGIAIRMMRFPLMFLAGMLGLYGMIIGSVLIAVHLCQLQSFGVPYLSGLAPLRPAELKDILIRAPWYRMKARTTVAAKGHRKRFKSNA
jgi:spore germination protein